MEMAFATALLHSHRQAATYLYVSPDCLRLPGCADLGFSVYDRWRSRELPEQAMCRIVTGRSVQSEEDAAKDVSEAHVFVIASLYILGDGALALLVHHPETLH
jgi:hypothetical protein